MQSEVNDLEKRVGMMVVADLTYQDVAENASKINQVSKISNLKNISFRVEQTRFERSKSVNGHFWSNLCLNCIFKWT